MAPFISLDKEILSEKFEVIENTYDWKKKYKLPLYLVMQLFFLLKNISKVDYILVSFGGYWALLPSILGYLFKKPTLIIMHGTDCAGFKEINYGSFRKPILGAVLKTSYKFATRLLPVSESLIYTKNTYFKEYKEIQQGVKHFFPKLKTEWTVVSNAVDHNEWKIDSKSERVQNMFITVMGPGQFNLKGGNLILEAAIKCPQFEFLFIGINEPDKKTHIPPNVKFLGRMNASELMIFYNQSKYYLQLSNFEGFGVALCEAMLCGCIPIVSNVNDLPNIIKDTGYILKTNNADLLSKLLKRIVTEKNNELGQKARLNIINNYSVMKRKNELERILH
jgi:glycosyltransferase involved in cell wall biosynthesis